MNTDENVIERQIEIKAPVQKVWEALTDSTKFGQWFNASFESWFVAGKTSKARNTSKEEPTLVEFYLEKTSSGTLVKVKESGFNKITASRRAKAFEMHSGGWEAQLRNIEKYVVEKK